MSKASVYYILNKPADRHAISALKRELDNLPGVYSVTFSARSNCVAVDYDTTGVQSDRIKARLEGLGYEVRDVRSGLEMQSLAHEPARPL